MRGGALRGYLTSAALLVSPALALALTPHDKAVGVQADQKPQGAIHAQEQTQNDKRGAGDPLPFVSPAQATSQQGDAGQHGDGREQEGTEFWPMLLGYKFKITDSLIAISTLVLTVFTGLLWRSTEKLWTAGELQIKLTRLALESAETPYLVSIVRAFDDRIDPPPPSPAMIPLVSICFENCGRSPATVLEVRFDTLGSKKTPEPTTFPPNQINMMVSYILAPGRISELARFSVGSFTGWIQSDHEQVAWLMGHVRYADVFGNQFLTGFCYFQTNYQSIWRAQGGPAYNYRRKLTSDEQGVADKRDRGLNTFGMRPSMYVPRPHI